MDYFKPAVDAFVSALRSRDRSSSKEWEYINAVGIWTEMGLSALLFAKYQSEEDPRMTRKLALAVKSFRLAFEVMFMRVQYFRDITDQRVEAASQMAFLVEQEHDTVFFESHKSAGVALTSKLEIPATKTIAKARL